MAFLEDLVDGNERLERLDFVGENWLAVVGSALSFKLLEIVFGA